MNKDLIFVVEIVDKRLFKEIKSVIDPLAYIECGVCGAIKVDARELLKSLSICSTVYLDSDEEEYEEEDIAIGETLEKLLWKLVESEPDCDFDDINQIMRFIKWRKENAHRLCGFPIMGESDEVRSFYMVYEEVLLFTDKDCDCFNKMKEETRLTPV